MGQSKLNIYLSTFNLFLIFVGYQLVTSIFLPNYYTYEGTQSLINTRIVTIPYRALALGVSLLVIVLNWREKIRLNIPLKLYFIFWGLLSIRILYDLKVRTDIVVDVTKSQETIIYTFLTCLLPAFSVLRSIRSIDFNLAFKWIFIGYVILIPIFYYNNPFLFSLVDAGVRLSGNIAMNTISFGQYGVTLALLALFWKKQSDQIWQIVLSILLVCVGIFIMLRSGSRGPLMTLIGCLIFFFTARQRSYIGSLCILLLLVVLLLSFSTVLLDKIQELSPVMASRLSLSGTETQFEELSNGRSSMYGAAIAKFANHPVLGDTFAIFYPNGSFTYCHNIILDAFMGLGLFGGILFTIMLFLAFRSSFQMVLHQKQNWWLALLCIQSIISYMFSGGFYYAGSLNALLIIMLSIYPI